MLAGAVFEQQAVTSVDFAGGSPFTVSMNTTSLRAHTVIIATGADSRWLGVPGEHEYRGGGVSSCATCDGFLFRDQKVVVIGGGDTAMEDALVLARTSKSVLLIHRRDSFRASKVLADRVLSNPKITVRWNSVATSFSGKEEVASGEMAPQSVLTHVHIRGVAEGAVEEKYACAAAFVAIGHIPNTALFASEGVTMDGNGYIVPRPGSATRTEVDGVFAAGDVADHVYRQAVTSAGTGAMAALDAERWLSERGVTDANPGAAAPAGGADVKSEL
jgi:thioredoxin reductase